MNFVGSVPRGRAGTSGYAGTSGVSGYSGYAPASDPSAIVSGAGTAAANGTYTERGTNAGKPYYNLVGHPDDPDKFSIVFTPAGSDPFWFITDGTGGEEGHLYDDEHGTVAFPWEASEWFTNVGTPPAPTVTQG